MRFPGVVALVVLASVLPVATAHAKKPVLRERDVFDDVALPCQSGKTWPVVMTCLAKTFKPTKARLEIAFDNGKLKVVSATVAPGVRELIVYTQVAEDAWQRSTLTIRSNTFSEILGVEALQTPVGESVRVDIGTTTRSSFVVSPAIVVRGVIRRRTTHVCMPNRPACQAFVTTCEAYAHGKVYWLFHGEPAWHPSLGMRLRGTRALGGTVCSPAASLLLDEDE